jgi:ammonia channel protein AmtB
MVETGLTRSKNSVNILAKELHSIRVISPIFFTYSDSGFMFGNGNDSSDERYNSLTAYTSPLTGNI